MKALRYTIKNCRVQQSSSSSLFPNLALIVFSLLEISFLYFLYQCFFFFYFNCPLFISTLYSPRRHTLANPWTWWIDERGWGRRRDALSHSQCNRDEAHVSTCSKYSILLDDDDDVDSACVATASAH